MRPNQRIAEIHHPKSRQKQPSCATCAHIIPADDNSGYCRRYPPGLKVDGISSAYVPVKLEWVCGEHRKRS
jgi:hypothetical protein